MPKLSELDDLYKTTVSKLPKADRLSYCNQRLDKAQYILEKNLGLLNSAQKNQLKEMIEAAQNEIKEVEES